MNDDGLLTVMMKVDFNDYEKIENIIKLIDHGPSVHRRSDWN